MNEELRLPAKFEDLSPWVSEWALATESARFNKRIHNAVPERQAFYDAIVPRMAAVMEYLEQLPMTDLPIPDQNLLSLALSYVEISRVVEVWKQQDVRADFFDPSRLNCIGYEGVQGA